MISLKFSCIFLTQCIRIFLQTQPSICPTNVMYPRDTARITSAALLGGAALGEI